MSFSASHAAALEDPMDFPDGAGPRTKTPEHIMSSEVESFDDRAVEDRSMDDRAYADDVAPTPMSHDRMAGEVISLDGMRDNLRNVVVPNFEQDDLDVPAFLRKRNEVM